MHAKVSTRFFKCVYKNECRADHRAARVVAAFRLMNDRSVRFTERRVGNVAAHGREPGESRRYTPAHGDGAEADGHRLGGQQHPLHGCERPRQTGHRLQEVLVRAESAHRARVHHELSIHGRSARRDPLHGK